MVASDNFQGCQILTRGCGGCRAKEHKSDAAYHSGLLLERVAKFALKVASSYHTS